MEEIQDSSNSIHIKLILIIYIISNFLLFLMNLILSLIHKKEEMFRENFFQVVYNQIIFSGLTNLFLIVISFLIYFNVYQNNFLPKIFSCVLNYLIIIDTNYHIMILLYLCFKTNERNSTLYEDSRGVGSISISKNPFRMIHIASFIVGIIHTIIFFFSIKSNVTDINNNNFYLINDFYYFFYPVETSLLKFLIFLPYLVIFIISIPYLLISINPLKITTHIQLKHYAIFCLLLSIINLITPISKTILSKILDVKDCQIFFIYFSSVLFLIGLIGCCFYRLNCLYIDYVLSNEGSGFVDKVRFGIKILLGKVKIIRPNFIDYNNSFIYHSLAYKSDFMAISTNSRDPSITTELI